MDVNYILLLFVAIVMALAYGILGYFSARMSSGETWNWPKFFATVVYSIVVGFLAVQVGAINLENIANWQTIFSPIWAEYLLIYTGLLYVFQKIVPAVWDKVANRTYFYPKVMKVDPARKMDQETRDKFFNDQKDAIRVAILKAVDEAEAKTTFRYAIEAGAWIYLVEFGEVTGAKHYFFKQWFGTSVVSWKPITVECLETIRKTGKFPDYDDLY